MVIGTLFQRQAFTKEDTPSHLYEIMTNVSSFHNQCNDVDWINSPSSQYPMHKDCSCGILRSNV